MFGKWTETDRLPQLIMKYQTFGFRSQGRPFQRLLDCQCDRHRSRCLKPCRLYDDDDHDDHTEPQK